ncbi:CDP-glycerol glycerophosphotransferase family protein [Methanobrevibacter sp.]|uniref:bifunctional glycosyltransferase/CDP-glycerol:glycerophosphate glycerophosphotransferase n=1 Tax=Methanobrevibacter sp. TaxID=66852 RepID=UPI0038910B38
MDFKFSVVMAVYNKEKYIAEALDSIIGQTLGFYKNIQMILVNDNSTDNTLDVLERYRQLWPENIMIISNEKNMGSAYSRNVGLEHVEGKYVNFLDSDDYVSKDAFKTAYDFLEEYYEVNIASIPIEYVGVKRGPHNLNFKFERRRIVNLVTDPQYIQLSGASSFFRYERLKDYRFNENLRVSEDALLINQMLLDDPIIAFLPKPTYFYRKDGTQNSLITSSASTKSYFTTRIDEYFFKLIESTKKNFKEVPKFIQYVLMYDLQWIVEIRKLDKLLNEDEMKTLYSKILELLTYIDEDVIFKQLSIPAALKAHVLSMKRHGWDYLKDKSVAVDNFKLNTLFIDNFEFINEHEAYISGIHTNFTGDSEILAVVDGEEYRTTPIRYPQRDNLSLNFNYAYNHNFRITLPVADGSRITFRNQNANLNINYNQTSRLNEISQFKRSKDYFAVNNDNEILIVKKSLIKRLKLEFATIGKMLNRRDQGWVTGVAIRTLYLVLYLFYRKKRIWLMGDLPKAAGDNSLALFKYMNSIKTDVKPIFILEKTAADEYEYSVSSRFTKLKRILGFGKSSKQFREVQKIGRVLPYRSLKHRIFTLFAEFLITSHPDNTIIYPFWGNYKYLSGLAKSKTVFLQHGVTKDNVSEWLNDFDKHLSMIVTVSDREKESFQHPDYGYSPDIFKTLGFPRFDFLEDNDERKEIVIMPSWRRQLDQLSAQDFVKTNFYNVFNELLSDDELIDFITENGYRLIFKPHRNLHKFIEAFTKHPSVTFDTDLTNFSQTFNNSSLIVTDYSSIAFDFAYLKKPLIYYQFDDNYHFDVKNAYFKYEDDGFGPVIRTHEELKKYIVDLIKNGCEMEDVYKKRVDEFFKYHDKNNSKRVYEAILELDRYY